MKRIRGSPGEGGFRGVQRGGGWVLKGLCLGVSQKGSREQCLPVFFSENETETNGRKRKNKRKQGKKKRKKTEENGRKWKKTEENGRKRKISEATPFRRPLLRNPDCQRGTGRNLTVGAEIIT